MQREEIVQYYDNCETDYRLLWDLDQSFAMHAGFWDQHTKTLREALKHENEVIAELAHIRPGERVLDAGCGVGGSAFFLAQQYQCDVVGITLSEKQVQTAQLNAKLKNIQPSPTFQVADFTKTSFPDHSFDIVWGIESICHAENKALFVKEAARLLKKGGRLIVADGFATQEMYSTRNQLAMEKWLKGWGVQSLDTVQAFEGYLKDNGFQNIIFRDVTPYVLPSSKRLYYYSWPAQVYSKIGEWLGLRSSRQTENILSARWQYQTLKEELWRYGVFYAEIS